MRCIHIHRQATPARFVLQGACIFIIAAIFTGSLRAQDTPRDAKAIQDTLKEIVSELREIRGLIGQSAARQSRIQLEIERYKIENDNVSVSRRHLEDVQTELANVVESGVQFAQQLAVAEAGLLAATDPDKRAALEAEVKDARASLEDRNRRESQLRGKEVQLTDLLQAEERKLSAMSVRLDAIEDESKTLEKAK